jgi:hypothetical protein
MDYLDWALKMIDNNFDVSKFNDFDKLLYEQLSNAVKDRSAPLPCRNWGDDTMCPVGYTGCPSVPCFIRTQYKE